ncbi:fimbria/pilus outer membrane usher protein [Providencia rettgeri]|uniref:fimbria/pilus outer membrane usher protein n=1 Tax=Providencia rettgeri TaxID=587 RepID=UPI001BCC7C0B|nr:fimbria/pilus outer membrane usher protein [Providencia rettgeri]
MSLNKTIKLLFPLQLCVPYIAVLITIFSSQFSYGKDYFSPASLDKRGLKSIADLDNLDVFSKSEGQLSGHYTVDVYLNHDTVGIYTLYFVNGDNGELRPVLTKQQWIEWGVDSHASPAFYKLSDETVINSIENIIPHATVNFDFSQQKLFLNIPQIAMQSTARGAVSPALWMQGAPAFLLDYNFSGAKTWAHNQDERAEFLSLRSGVNLGGWRTRNYSVYTHNKNHHQWDNIYTYVERDIALLKSQLTLGETITAGNIFDSFQFTGGKLASDDSMLPYSLRGFAPVVRGIARSEAQVTIKQNDIVIYQTYVSAGPFEIADLYPSSASGNLEVIVTEMDGSEQSFVIPFSSVPIMQREGQLNYNVSIGKYRGSNSRIQEPHFTQSTLIYGLPWNTTGYGGILYSADYQAVALGTGFNLGSYGALSIDMTEAHTRFKEPSIYSKSHGQSYRFQYAKSLLSTGTTVTLAGYRYSTEGYYDFAEANDAYSLQTRFNKRSKLQATLNQSLADYGSVYLNGYQQDYWGRSGKEKTVSAGYNTSWDNISYGINYTYSDMPDVKSANQLIAINFNIPFDSLLPNSRINTIMSTDNHGMTSMQVGLSGNAFDNTLNYQIQQGYGNKGQQNSSNASMSYKGRNGTVNSGVSYNSNYHRMNYGIQGGLVAHPKGITLSQSLGDTIAIVNTPDAEGVSIQNRTGISTNSAGYAIVPYLTPYQRNRIQLDVSSLGDQIDLAKNSTTVIPTRGAVVYADFQTHIGWRALVTLMADGKPIPFGSVATLENNTKSDASVNVSGIVSAHGEVYLSGLPEQGQIVAKWGTSKNQQCKGDFTLPQDKKQPVLQVIVECHITKQTSK